MSKLIWLYPYETMNIFLTCLLFYHKSVTTLNKFNSVLNYNKRLNSHIVWRQSRHKLFNKNFSVTKDTLLHILMRIYIKQKNKQLVFCKFEMKNTNINEDEPTTRNSPEELSLNNVNGIKKTVMCMKIKKIITSNSIILINP